MQTQTISPWGNQSYFPKTDCSPQNIPLVSVLFSTFTQASSFHPSLHMGDPRATKGQARIKRPSALHSQLCSARHVLFQISQASPANKWSLQKTTICWCQKFHLPSGEFLIPARTLLPSSACAFHDLRRLWQILEGKNIQLSLCLLPTPATPGHPSSSFTTNSEQPFHVYWQKYLWQRSSISGVLKL